MTRPLAGLKVLDFSTLLPGPYATQLLADMGAEVLRVEALGRHDLARSMPPFIEKGISAIHAALNRNKQSIALNLKKPEAIKVVYRLIEDYDIVIEQFRPEVMARLGLGYEELKKMNSRLIYCSITGYGQTGPLKNRAGHDINYLALSGLASYSGREETGPVLSGTQIADIAGGSHHAVMGILAAVLQRQATGEGQSIDISMTDCAFALNAMFGANSLASGKSPKAGREFLNGGIFYDYYRTSDDRWISVGSLEPQFAQGFFAAIGHPEWLGRAVDQTHLNQQSLKSDVDGVLSSKSFNEWMEVFEPLDICVEPVLDVQEAAGHSHFTARKMVVDLPVSEEKSVAQIANPIKFSGSEAEYRKAGGMPGEDTRAVLDKLGYSPDELDALLGAGTFS
ncbi:CoA transferase [Sansalvadorimonas sp. 2012CJ34-2]|uniref:CoA transferase n=1 Tax=Parendozoicomonas callyspongiae TaxID=2942213 RepID=A0ABT0PHR3_9GAMM|nr:CaiB/BaiF CoA-transferase family protein [Sansalvadorimonas sp. 2012CJ34-2]MCL6270878.1 CoA transferase [Sansalvadorimonas sp. 2012CJ34-2]